MSFIHKNETKDQRVIEHKMPQTMALHINCSGVKRKNRLVQDTNLSC